MISKYAVQSAHNSASTILRTKLSYQFARIVDPGTAAIAPSYRTPGESRRTVKPNRVAPSASEPYRDINKFKYQQPDLPIDCF
jgi:hypothetical protein